MSEDDEVRDENRRTRAPAAEVVRATATPDDYAEAIRGAYRDTVEGIFRMGRLLIDAKEDLLHGEFESMVEEDLPFGPRSARMLKTIARDERLRNRKHVSDLPPACSTLSRLTRLTDDKSAAVEPPISPELSRAVDPLLGGGSTDDPPSGRGGVGSPGGTNGDASRQVAKAPSELRSTQLHAASE